MANASVPMLLWPPYESCDPSRPRVDLIAFMVDPKKVVDQDYQGVEITNDRIFLDGARYGDLERETQEKVRRELQICFTEQGCGRTISVKEWAKQTTERQTPRLRLRCIKVCGFGFQVNFDMERNQYYLVRSRGKSGNFCHKCPAPAVSLSPPLPSCSEEPAAAAAAVAMPPPLSSAPVFQHMPSNTEMMAHSSLPAHRDGIVSAPSSAPVPFVPSSSDHLQQAIPEPHPPTIDHGMRSSQTPGPTFHDPSHVPASMEPSMTPINTASTQIHGVPSIIPSADHTGSLAPVISFSSAGGRVPENAAESSHAHFAEFQDMDVCSVDSTDMMIARHFGTDHQHASTKSERHAAALSSLSDSSEMPRIGDTLRSNSRAQVFNEAEYPTVNSLRSFLSMMTGSINSIMGKSVSGAFALNRNQSHTSSNENMGAAGSQNVVAGGPLHRIDSVNDTKAIGSVPVVGAGHAVDAGDPMDTVNSALSGLSISGMGTLGTPGESAPDDTAGDPFSADFWSPPPPAPP